MSGASNIISEDLPFRPMTDDIWKLILDRQHIPETLIHMLRGEVWVVTEESDSDGNPIQKGKWDKRGRPLMNEIGIRFFTPFIYSTVTPDKLTTKLSDDEVNRLVREMLLSIVEVMMERGDEFEVSASDRSYVVRLIEQNYYISLTGSRMATILDTLKPTMRREERILPVKDKKDMNYPIDMSGGNR